METSIRDPIADGVATPSSSTPSTGSSEAPTPQRAPAPEWARRLGGAITPVRAGLAITLALSAFLLCSVERYGITSDSPALFYAGDRTLFWMQHPRLPGALDFLGDEPASFHSKFGRQPDHFDPVHYPVLPGFIAAVTNHVFHVKLGWVDHIDGHHIGLVLLNAVALFLFCLYACRLLGKSAGIAATVALALFPVAVGHAPNNAKDWPCAMFYALTVLAAGVGVLQERARHLLAAGVLLGIALACKMNAAFVIPTLLLWAPIAYLTLYHRRRAVPAGVVGGFLLAPYIAAIVFFVTWPWLYYGRLPQWWEHLAEYVRFMVNYGAGRRTTLTSYSIVCLGLMTPPLVLLAAAAYAATGWRGRRELALWSLLMVWVGLPILRIALPGSNFYDANRHFIEYVPALCAVAGLGFVWAARKLWAFVATGPRASLLRGRMPVAVMGTAGALALGCLVWPVAEYHPYEASYFNSFIGGLGGAQRSALFYFGPPSDVRVNGTEGDYWFSSAREGARDLRGYMKPGDRVGMCGPGREHARANWAVEPIPYLYETHEKPFGDTEYLYISPRETLCWWRQVRQFESERPILKRVERGGGLIYEILGARDGVVRAPVSPESEYERRGHPHDTEGARLKRLRQEQSGVAAPK